MSLVGVALSVVGLWHSSAPAPTWVDEVGRSLIPVYLNALGWAGQIRATVPTLTAIKVMLYQGMREQAIGKAELARRLGWHLPQVDRVLDIRHRSRLDRMDAALGAITCRLEVRARDDASMAAFSALTSASLPNAVGTKEHGG